MLRLHEIFAERTENLTYLMMDAKEILKPPTAPAATDNRKLDKKKTRPVQVEMLKVFSKSQSPKVICREAEAIIQLYNFTFDLRSKARILPQIEQEKLITLINDLHDEGKSFTARLTEFHSQINSKWFKGLIINNPQLSRHSVGTEENLIHAIHRELGWLYGDELERAFLVNNQIAPFGIFKGEWSKIFDKSGVCRAFDPAIMDEITMLARSQNREDIDKRSSDAKALYQLNLALLELDLYTHDAESVPDRELLDSIIKIAQTDQPIDLTTRLINIKNEIERPEVNDLIGKDAEVGRILKEILSAIFLLGIGYAIAKAYDVSQGNSFFSCVFFKDPTHQRVWDVLKPINELLSSNQCDESSDSINLLVT